MRLLQIAVGFSALALFTGAAFAQNGIISGTVSNSVGEPLDNAPVQARDSKSSAVFKATSSKTGGYSLANLPAGTYDVTVNVAGLNGFDRKGVAVSRGGHRECQRAAARRDAVEHAGRGPAGHRRQSEIARPACGTHAAHAGRASPIFRVSGGLLPSSIPASPEWTPAGRGPVAKKRADDNRIDSPQSHCMPAGVTRLGPLYELVQSPEFIVEISDDDSPGFHQIYLDGHKHPADPNPAWYGHNVGHWEGDTLVVDRVAFDERVWLDQGGHPHSDKLHIVERYRRPDLGHLETEVTVDDPGVLAKPFTQKRVSELAAGLEINEFICTENERDNRHFVR